MPARDKARVELVRIGRPAVPDLLIALDDAETRGRVGAAMVLGAINDPRAAEPLIKLLGHSSPDLRGAAYQALLSIGPPAVPALLDALEKPGKTERTVIVRILASIGDYGATEALVALLRKDPSTSFRMEVATALGRIKDRTACDALLDALRDSGVLEIPHRIHADRGRDGDHALLAGGRLANVPKTPSQLQR